MSTKEKAAIATTYDDAELLARAGYELMPLHAQSKRPKDKNWQRRHYDVNIVIAEARKHGWNLGVRLRATDLIIDVDPRNGGRQSLIALVADVGLELERYPHILTGGDGDHYYLTKPADIETKSKLPQYPGIDFKTFGGQVVAPGSIHPVTGKRYESEYWLRSPDEITGAPQALLDLLRVSRVVTSGDGENADLWGEIDAQQLSSALSKLPIDDYGEGSYEKWFLLMSACHHATAGAGREEFIAWSVQSPDFPDHGEDIGSKWDSLSLKGGSKGRPTTIRYLYKVLNEYGISIPSCNPEDDFEPFTLEELAEFERRSLEVRLQPRLISRKGNKKVENSFPNCLMLVRRMNERLGLVFDEFKGTAELTHPTLPWDVDVGRRLSDDVVRQMRQLFVDSTQLNWMRDDISEAMMTVARNNSVHPVREYLNRLCWDGVSRLDLLLPMYCGTANTPYTRDIGAKTLIAAVRRIRQPGCKFDNVLVLEGDQGCGKSTFVKYLSPNIEWFTDSPIGNTENKDAALALQGNWIVELGEMSVLNKSGVEALKAFVSSSIDHVRRPYGRIHEELRRQCIFIGTTNHDNYLKDQTGNRRFWPAKVGIINLDALLVDRNQLWAEAATREAAGESLVLRPELWEAAATEQEARVSDDPWADTLRDYLDGSPNNSGFGPIEAIDRIHSSELLTSALCIRPAELTATHSQRLKVVMTKKLGWIHKDNIRAGAYNKQGKGYQRV